VRTFRGSRAGAELAAALVVVLTSSACAVGDADDRAAQVPDGWQELEVDGVRFQLPADFESVEGSEDDALAAFVRGDRSDPEEAELVRLLRSPATTTAGDTLSVESYLGLRAAEGGLTLAGYEMDETETTEVPGAIEAMATQSRYDLEGGAVGYQDMLVFRTGDHVYDLRYARILVEGEGLAPEVFATVSVER
jgi:hypothetical protein